MISTYDVIERYAAEAQKGAPETVDPNRGDAAVQTKRYYFFEAPPENAIKFTALNDILQKDSPEKQSMITKLEGGNTGARFADYFVWNKVCLRTNKYSQDGKTFVSYTCDLNPFGTKRDNTEQILPTDAPVTAETIETDFLLFEDKAGNAKVINPDKSTESVYVDREAPNDIGQMLLKNIIPTGNKMGYDDFSRKFDEYRIWVPNMRQLVLPDFNLPTHDHLKKGYGHYEGGDKAFNTEVAPYIKEQPEKPEEESLGKKLDQDEVKKGDPQAPAFKPGTEPVKPTQGDKVEEGDSALKTASKKKKRRRSGDYASEPYSGGTNVMQKLVKDQHENMDIRQAARRVMAQIMSTGPSQSATGTSTTGTPSVPISNNPKKNDEASRLFKDIAKKQEEIAKFQQQVIQKVSNELFGS